MRLGNALGEAKSFEDSRERYRQALDLAAAIGDGWLQCAVLTNMSCNESDAGEPERAVETAEMMMAVAAAAGVTLNLLTLSHLAEAYIGVGRYAEAERTLLAGLLDETLPAVQLNDRAMALFYLAQAQRHAGALDRASDSLRRCQQICDERDLVWDQVHIKQEWAALYAAHGDFARAYQVHQGFHRASEALHSAEREAQARTRQAMYETTEARQQADLYHEQARRDPLTGLLNRRHVDERLPALVEHATRTGDPLVVALVDLDHFKRINDTCSHETGDRVLATVAGLLAAAVTPTAAQTHRSATFAARMGGEEFLLALVGCDPGTAARHLDDVRRTVAAHPWSELTGAMAITVSIGAASTAAVLEPRPAALLGRADAFLYRAKRQGRDRVVGDGI
jgi:diguanylate cyclase (GGDEF)-like protein